MKAFFLTALLLASVAQSAEPESMKVPKLSPTSPYAEGTEDLPLQEGTLKRLLEVTDSIAERFKEAKAQARGKDLPQINQIYRDTFLDAVARSAELNNKLETLSRIAVNTGYQIIWGVPAADRQTFLEPPVLDSIANSDLVTTIIEDSMNLALRYYKDDREGLEKQDLVRLPYAKFAYERLLLVEKWSRAVFEPAQAYALLVHGLKRWDSITRRQDNLSTLSFAGEILLVRKALARADEIARTDGKKGARNFLRGELNRLLASLEKNLGRSDIVEALTPEMGLPPTAEKTAVAAAPVRKRAVKDKRPYSEIYARVREIISNGTSFQTEQANKVAAEATDLVVQGDLQEDVLAKILGEGIYYDGAIDIGKRVAHGEVTLNDFVSLYQAVRQWISADKGFDYAKTLLEGIRAGRYTQKEAIASYYREYQPIEEVEELATLAHKGEISLERFKKIYEATHDYQLSINVCKKDRASRK